jgi:hypothetical protein
LKLGKDLYRGDKKMADDERRAKVTEKGVFAFELDKYIREKELKIDAKEWFELVDFIWNRFFPDYDPNAKMG